MKPDIARAVSILKRELLFQGLELSQLARVVSFFNMVEYPPNQVVFSEGDRPEYFYIVMSGNVRITRQERGKDQLLNVLGIGDFFGEQALLFDHPRSASVTTQGQTTLLRLSRERFRVLMEEYPQIRSNMGATAECRRLLRKLKFNWLADNEVIYYLTRPHYIDVLGKLFGPLFLLITGLSLIGFMIWSEGVRFFATPLGIIGILLFLPGVLWLLWVLVDWMNDYYIVTNQRVVWLEKVVAMYDSRHEEPLNTVLAVNVSSSQLGRILGYGTVDVRSYTGGIHMERVNDPELFASFVEGYRKRALAISRAKEAQEMGDEINKALRRTEQQVTGNIPVATAPPALRKEAAWKQQQPKRDQSLLRTFLKVRFEEDTKHGKIITYRKHWFLLLQSVLMSLTVVVMSFFLLAAMALSGALPLLFIPIAGFIWLILVGWLVYEYLDWSNDIYKLTPDQLIHIERKPLGREQKTTTGLDAPDFRIEHTRENFIGILLDFGTVTVRVGQTEFIFRGVYHPDRVHQDVSNYREALQVRRKKEREKGERDQMMKWLVAYHEQAGPASQLEQTEISDSG